METNCPHYDYKKRNKHWCEAFQWNLTKGFNNDPCVKCIENPKNKEAKK